MVDVALLYQQYIKDLLLQRPGLLIWAVPAIIIVLFLIRRTFVDVREDQLALLRRRKARKIMMVTRTLMILLLALAFATPATVQERTIQTDPFVKLLVDNSTSMGVYDLAAISTVEEKLAGKIGVRTASIANGERSVLGESLLARVQKGDNVLLVTDGQTTGGPSLGDVSLFAAANNITLSLLRLPIKNADAWVTIEGPSKTAAGTESTFVINVGTLGKIENVHVTIKIDDVVELDTSGGAQTYTIKKTLGEGTHKMVALIDSNDAFSQNNIYYKTVRAVPKPRVFYWTDKSSPPLLTLYDPFYKIERGTSLPSSLDDYYAIVIDDMPQESMPLDSMQRLNSFVSDGGGLFVVGGPSSYDRGGYTTHPIKNLIPVFVGSPGRDLGDVNLVIIIDASGSAGGEQGAGLTISRALTLGLIQDMDPKTRIGVVAFSYDAQVVSPLALKSQTADLADKVRRIYGSGGSNMADAMKLGIEMLQKAQGSKNLVIISDGLLLDQIAAESRNYAKAALDNGIKVYTIGAAVGDEAFIRDRVNEEFMQEIADISHGTYFRASTASRLKLLFNPPKEDEKKNVTDRSATVLDSNHFITKDFLFKDALLTGYNAVIPKTSARLLATLSSGEPLLTVWRLGLGRVASLATDDGIAWSGPLLNADNNPLLLRTLNWAIGDPDRKAKNRVEVFDGTVNEPLDIIVTSESAPITKEITLVRTGENTYKGSTTPTEPGFINVLGATAAVNGPAEYRQLGESKALTRAVATTDGRFFAPDAIEQIAELAKKKSMQVVREELPLRWPLAVLVFALWIIELIARRVLGKS